jgi:hypothetical protein
MQPSTGAVAGWLQGWPSIVGPMNTTQINQPVPLASAPATSLSPAVDRFLAAVQAAAPTADLYTADATLDATVPGWRFHRHGGVAVSAEYAAWFSSPGSFEELDRIPVSDGEIVTYFLAWEEHGVPHAAHHCHRIVVDPATGRIAEDRVFCGGRWNAELLASMAEAGR